VADKIKLYLEISQRIAGIYAAGKNGHYSFRNYADHLLFDRFVDGEDDEDGFDCFDMLDEIQETMVMYRGESLDVNQVLLYPEEYSVPKSAFAEYAAGSAAVAALFDGLVEKINGTTWDNAEGDLFGNIARRAQRASAFIKRTTKGQDDDGRKNRTVAEDNAAGGGEVAS